MRIIRLLSILFIVAAGMTQAGQGGLGAGLVFNGHEVGLTLEKTLQHHKLLGVTLYPEAAHADYLWHNEHLLHFDQMNIPVFYGGGFAVHWSEHEEEMEFHLSLRAPVGGSYYVVNEHWESFMELVPTLGLGEHTDVNVNWGVGLRYHF